MSDVRAALRLGKRPGAWRTDLAAVPADTWLAIAVGVMAGAFLSRAAAFSAHSMSLCWPPAGIAYAALEVLGPPALLPVAAGILAWAVVAYAGTPAMVPFALAASLLGPIFGVAARHTLLERGALGADPAKPLHRLLAFYVGVALVGAPAAAALGSIGLQLGAQYADQPWVAVFAGYWLVECLGVLLFAPAAAELLAAPRGQRLPRFDAATLLGAALLAGLSVLLVRGIDPEYARVLGYLFLPLAAFCGMRCDARATHCTLLACATLLLTTLAYNYDALALSVSREFVLLEGALVVFLGTALAQVLHAVSSERARALASLARAAREDPATGFLNARGLEEVLAARLADGNARGFGVIGVRLRNLEAALDLLEPADGARLVTALQQTFARLPGVAALARPEPARVVALYECGGLAQLESSAEKLLREAQSMRVAAGQVVMRIAPAVGAVWAAPRIGLAPAVVQLALREAELDGALQMERPLRVRAVDGSAVEAQRARLELVERVREAILARRMRLLAQRIVPNRTECALDGHDVEVLIRLIDARGSVMAPAEFLPAVVSGDLAVDLDRAVVRNVFDWFAQRGAAFARTAKCAINLSATSLGTPGFIDFVHAELAASRLSAARLAFEITESSELINPLQAAAALDTLRGMGFRVALDDFGTGLSTFDYLKKLPVDYIKIDGSFIRNLDSSPVDAEIVGSIVRVAAQCRLRTVAEYVATPQLRAEVTRLGVDYSQGYAIAQPEPIEDVLR
jgi:EAL domain-containing protein (putative c-di-GMP-specific phosphodiesterase class I)/GGDEF domain-containing protein